jgi:hypothetical protein
LCRERPQNIDSGIRNIYSGLIEIHRAKVERAIQNSLPLTIGPLQVSREGIGHSTKRNLLIWRDIKSVQINESEIYFDHRRETFSWLIVRVAEVPNLPLFIYALYRYADEEKWI